MHFFIYFYHCHWNICREPARAGVGEDTQKGKPEAGTYYLNVPFPRLTLPHFIEFRHAVCLASVGSLTKTERLPECQRMTDVVGDNQVRIGANVNKRAPGVFCSILYNVDFCPTLIYFVLSCTWRRGVGFLCLCPLQPRVWKPRWSRESPIPSQPTC